MLAGNFTNGRGGCRGFPAAPGKFRSVSPSARGEVSRGGRLTPVDERGRRVIPPKARGEFAFVARNPTAAGPVLWKARQRFADGTSADWVGVEGDRRPAFVTTVTSSRQSPSTMGLVVAT
jgi:hypothetical protein